MHRLIVTVLFDSSVSLLPGEGFVDCSAVSCVTSRDRTWRLTLLHGLRHKLG
jgi:hypothetical protein